MLEISEILIRLLTGAFCGAIIGIERERKEWAAGMRTHMMVSVGATLYMIVSIYGFNEVLNHDNVSIDPSRVASQVVSGIGFIGAGTIIFLRQGVVRGLTTASGLWTVAGIGLAIGGGMYVAGVATTLIALIILWILQPIESFVYRRSKWKSIIIMLKPNSDYREVLELILEHQDINITGLEVESQGEEEGMQLTIKSNVVNDLKKIIVILTNKKIIQSVKWHE
jgi:putative Mg2+ transporter-C (MgtC) family protein